jgi:hypothetical protein
VLWFSLAALLCFFHSPLPAGEERFALAPLSYSVPAPAFFEQSDASSASWLEKSLETALADGRNSEALPRLHSPLKQSQINPVILLNVGIDFAQKVYTMTQPSPSGAAHRKTLKYLKLTMIWLLPSSA